MFAHATAIMVLTPDGKIAQYYYGVEYAPKDLRLGTDPGFRRTRSATLADQVLLYCYHYDPTTGKYGAIISRVLQLSALATVLGSGNAHDRADPFWIGTQQQASAAQVCTQNLNDRGPDD